MTRPTKKNVIVGAASIYLGPEGTDKPTVTAGASFRTLLDTAQDTAPTDPTDGTEAAAWDNVGYTQDGLSVSTDPSFGEVEVDQVLDSVRTFKDGMGFSLSTTFAEATLKNLMYVWGQSEDSISTTADGEELDIEGGTLGETPNERGFIAIGNAPEAAASNKFQERTYHVFRVLSVEGSEHSLARSDATVLPVTFRALPADDTRYGVIRDRVVT